MSAPIRPEDSPQERIAKLLPADITAAFLSAKAALIAGAGESAASYIFWTFVAIIVISPFYFWYVTKVKSFLQIGFLIIAFVVFAISIADKQFTAFLQNVLPSLDVEPVIRMTAIVLPILWAFLIAQIFVAAMGDKVASDNQAGPRP